MIENVIIILKKIVTKIIYVVKKITFFLFLDVFLWLVVFCLIKELLSFQKLILESLFILSPSIIILK